MTDFRQDEIYREGFELRSNWEYLLRNWINNLVTYWQLTKKSL